MTTLFDDIETVWRYGAPAEPRIDVEEAIDRLVALSDEFTELAPDWNEAPEWAQWYTIDADGTATWTVDEPTVFKSIWRYFNGIFAGFVNLFLGIDWRLCKWQRPAVQ